MASNAEDISIWWRHHAHVMTYSLFFSNCPVGLSTIWGCIAWHPRRTGERGLLCGYTQTRVRPQGNHLWIGNWLGFRYKDKSTLVQVIAWCLAAPSHYLNHCWPIFMSPYSDKFNIWCRRRSWGALVYNVRLKKINYKPSLIFRWVLLIRLIQKETGMHILFGKVSYLMQNNTIV